MTTPQWIALGIFILSYGLIISEKVNRTIASIFGAVLAFLFILTPQDILHYENWETILFIFGMMTVIETMNESGFFRWLGLHSARAVKLDPLKLFILFPFIAAFLSAFVDSITVMLFMATLTIGVFVNALFFIVFYKGQIFPARKRLLENPDWVQKQIENIDPKGAIQDRR